MHITAFHSRFTNCAPNTRVLTSQGSWIEMENIIQAFFTAAGGCYEMSVHLPLATQLPEMHPFSDIQHWLVLILYWYQAYLFSFPWMCCIPVVPQPWQTGKILVAAKVGVADKMAKNWPFTSLVVLTAHLTVFNRSWMLFCWKKGWSLAWIAERCFFLRSYFHFRAEAADLAGCSKVYHEVMSLSRMKGERNSPFNFIQMLSYV